MIVIYIVMYLIFGVLWAQFSYEIDKIICPQYDKTTNFLFYIVNLLFFPIPLLQTLMTGKYTINNIKKKIIENLENKNK